MATARSTILLAWGEYDKLKKINEVITRIPLLLIMLLLILTIFCRITGIYF